MSILVLLLVLVVANIIYVTAFFAGSIRLGIHSEHYFLGSGRALFSLSVRGVKISIGFYLPVLSRIYSVVDGRKERLRYPWEFQEKPILRRLAVTLCGPIALAVAGMLIFILSTFTQELIIIPRAEVNRLGIYPSATAEIVGFRRGDRILKLNGEEYEDFYELVQPAVLESHDTYYTVLRNGQEIKISLSTLPEGYIPDYNELFISLLAPFTVREVAPNTPAAEAGIKYGDKITHVNGNPVIKYTEVLDAINNDTTGTVTVTVNRALNDSTYMFSVDLTADSMIPGRNRIGILPNELYATEIRHNTLTEAISRGIRMTVNTPVSNVRAFVKIISGRASKRRLGGPIGGTNNSRVTVYLWAIAMFSIFFAYANFLPLPRSAFWEFLALGYETVTKKQFPYRIFKLLGIIALVLVIAGFTMFLIFDITRLLI